MTAQPVLNPSLTEVSLANAYGSVAQQDDRGRNSVAECSTMRYPVVVQFAARLRYPALVCMAILGCYYGLWNAYFTSDDFWMLGWVRHQPTLGDAIWTEFGYSVRILLDALLWIRVRWFELDPTPYYWMSLVQHTLVTLLVYWLAKVWTRRSGVALIAALLFGTTSTHFEVVTWITGSNYSLAASAYLGALGFFGLYIDRGNRTWLAASTVMFIAGLMLTELAISLPLVLLAYRLTIGRDQRVRLVGWRHLRVLTPFWILLGLYLVTQVMMMSGGNSEAAKAEQIYRPGLHVLTNLTYLLYLALPPYGPPFLVTLLGAAPVDAGLLATAVAGHCAALLLLWRGSPVVKFAVAFTYLTFLPYSMWQGDFAAAIRYRYLPAIGFSLLIALFLARLNQRMLGSRTHAGRYIVPGLLALLLVTNVILVQTWVRRHLENSSFRRLTVMQLADNYSTATPGTRFLIEVPAEKFVDIGRACLLVFLQPTRCQAFVDTKTAPVDLGANPDGSVPTYWLRATDEGLRQVYPVTARTP